MIDVRELRVGNYLKTGRRQVVRVLAWYGNSIYSEAVTVILLPKGRRTKRYLHPITLTPEILVENCGFQLDEEGDYFIYIRDCIGQIRPLCIFLHSEGTNIRFQGVYILCASLHQLQNLYYALTGTEMEIHGL